MPTSSVPDPASKPPKYPNPLAEMHAQLITRLRASGTIVTECVRLKPGQLIATFPGKRPPPPPARSN